MHVFASSKNINDFLPFSSFKFIVDTNKHHLIQCTSNAMDLQLFSPYKLQFLHRRLLPPHLPGAFRLLQTSVQHSYKSGDLKILPHSSKAHRTLENIYFHQLNINRAPSRRSWFWITLGDTYQDPKVRRDAFPMSWVAFSSYPLTMGSQAEALRMGSLVRACRNLNILLSQHPRG